MNSISRNASRMTLAGLIVTCLVMTGACSSADTGATEPGLSLGNESVPNLRDLGGYKTADDATVIKGLIYRSNQLVDITVPDLDQIASLGLKVDYDLRTAAEIALHADELPPGVEYVSLDVLADAGQSGAATLEQLLADPIAANALLGGGKAKANFITTYRQFITLGSAKTGFRTLFLALGDPARLPALFHCTTGKDRTGWAAAAFLSLMGVPKETIFKDYLRSNDYILPKYEKTIRDFIAGGGEPEIPPAILGVQEAYLNAAFDEMTTQYQTIGNYFSDALGIDASQQQALRDLFLVYQ